MKIEIKFNFTVLVGIRDHNLPKCVFETERTNLSCNKFILTSFQHKFVMDSAVWVDRLHLVMCLRFPPSCCDKIPQQEAT